APAEVPAGSDFEVSWTGPDNRGDFITIVPAGAPEGTWDGYEYTSAGSPVTLRAPEQPGEYEVRYATGAEYSTLARTTVTVTAVSGSRTAPRSVVAGADVEVSWTGPDNSGDFITIVEAGAEEGSWGNYAYTAEGNPVTLQVPDVAGEYEVRYVTGSDYITL